MLSSNIFVFGSNLAGIHGAGAAYVAYKIHGATWKCGVGLQGNSYAIPTKDAKLNTLPLDIIKTYVEDFIKFAEKQTYMNFMVTKIGCGLAQLEARDIAPFFKPCLDQKNVKLPKDFLDILCPNGYSLDKISFMW